MSSLYSTCRDLCSDCHTNDILIYLRGFGFLGKLSCQVDANQNGLMLGVLTCYLVGGSTIVPYIKQYWQPPCVTLSHK